MVDPNPALGISADFDADQFRNAIRFAMQMGTPPDVDKQPVFVFKPTGRSYWKNSVQLGSAPRLDRDGKPLDPTIEVRVVEAATKRVDCAVEIIRADAEELPVGTFRQTKAIVTLLDEQYEQVVGCTELVFDGDRYRFGYEPDGLGLFSVGINTMIFYPVEET
jgi:hypothetical protein